MSHPLLLSEAPGLEAGLGRRGGHRPTAGGGQAQGWGWGWLGGVPHLEQLSFGEAREAVAGPGLGAQQQVVQGDPHLPVQLAHLLLLGGGHCLPAAPLKLLQLACERSSVLGAAVPAPRRSSRGAGRGLAAPEWKASPVVDMGPACCIARSRPTPGSATPMPSVGAQCVYLRACCPSPPPAILEDTLEARSWGFGRWRRTYLLPAGSRDCAPAAPPAGRAGCGCSACGSGCSGTGWAVGGGTRGEVRRGDRPTLSPSPRPRAAHLSTQSVT